LEDLNRRSLGLDAVKAMKRLVLYMPAMVEARKGIETAIWSGSRQRNKVFPRN